MRRAVASTRKKARTVLIRHALACVTVAALSVFVIEPWLVSGTTPLVASLSLNGRTNLYNQVIIVSAALLGFMLTAITILVSLDTGRRIVRELHYGEAFKLLIANMLATVLLLLVLTLMGIAGSSLDAAQRPAKTFEAFYEWIGVTSVLLLSLTGFYFATVTYKVAAYE
jgi:hypothetical protein